MKKIWILSLIVFGLVGLSDNNANAGSGKYLVILQAGTESSDGMARAVHALLYSKELKEHGYDVVLVFDGAGTQWVDKWTNAAEDDKYVKSYNELIELGIVQVICDYCAAAFKVKDSLQKKKMSLSDEYQGHPSVAKWVDEGYTLIIL